jgi:hypothetical protein
VIEDQIVQKLSIAIIGLLVLLLSYSGIRDVYSSYWSTQTRKLTAAELVGIYVLTNSGVNELRARGYPLQSAPTMIVTSETEFRFFAFPSCFFNKGTYQTVDGNGRIRRFKHAWDMELEFNPLPFGEFVGPSFSFQRRFGELQLIVDPFDNKLNGSWTFSRKI